MACTVVQTPQMRWAKTQASRGSRPFRISSIPRNMVDEDQASRDRAAVHLGLDPQMALDPGDGVDDDVRHDWPPFSSSSALRWASSAFSRAAGWCSAPPALPSDRTVGGEGRRPPTVAQSPDLVDAVATPKPGTPGRCGRRASSCPRSRAPRSRRSGGRQPIGQLVPSFQRTIGQFWKVTGPLAAHLVEAPALAVALVAPLLHVLAGVEVGPPLAVVVDRLAVGEERRRHASSAGQRLKVRKWTISAVMFSTLGGQAGEVDQVLDARHRVAARRRRPWGSGAAAGRPP